MAREYRQIRAVPEPALDGAAAAAPDYRAYSFAAGVLILLGLAMLITLGYLVYYTVYQFIPSLTVSRTAEVSVVVGTVEVEEAGTNRWSIVAPGQRLQEGDVIRTRDNSRVLVTLFDKSTAILYPQTQLSFTTMRNNRFGTALRSSPRTIVKVQETAGRASFGVAHLNPVASTHFTVSDGPVQATLDEGSYIVKVIANQTLEVVATRGSSVVSGDGAQVTIHGGERTQVRAGQKPVPPILAAEDLIGNGAFTQTDATGAPANWDILTPAPEGGDVPGRVRLTSDDSFPVVHFTRTGSTYHAEQGIRQTINQDVTDYSVVRLDLRFKVFSQSVSGGGDQGSEYPLMVRVNYLDQNGAPAFFVRGFYVQNGSKLPVTNGQQVNAGEWVNLTDASGIQLQQISPRPQFIQSIEVLASGHDYDSEIQKVSLVIE